EMKTVKKPGESHRLTCTFLDSFSSDWIAWIRQPPWKPLGWIVYISDDSSIINYGSSFESRFTMSRVNNLKDEDTAVYYCEGNSEWRLLSSCVSTGAQTALTSVFALSPCCSRGNAELLSLGCLASGYFPADSVTFKWMDADGKLVSDFLLYPSVKSGVT
uniref:Ig-like domain-containing protein n=1 Tax=Scleropages formosus TaxID=113540 RepID=A0A8C9TUE2_SCLFO